MNLKLVLTVVLLVAMIVPVVIATNCWSGGNYRGWFDGQDMTGPIGATKMCEAKLHVCFKGGAGDPAIPCDINTLRNCDAACSMATGCSPEVCASRCYAARVPGYADTCE